MKEELLNRCCAFLGKCQTDECWDGSVQIRSGDADRELYDRFLAFLGELGFAQCVSREEAGNCFADLTAEAGMQSIHVSYVPAEERMQVIVSEGEAIPPRRKEESPEPITTPLVTQVQLTYCVADCGMSYVIRLSDGRFAVIDGGYDEYEEADRLFELLQEQNVLERPTVAAWFFSHPHGDHVLCFLKLVQKYGDRIRIEDLVYNWASDSMCLYPCDHNAFDRVAEELTAAGSRRLTPHTGQRFCYADAEFDVLFACEDLYPEVIRNINNTSVVLRMELGGKRFLWLGDAEPGASDVICRRFPAASLRCDVLQVGHHGYGGGSPELYRRADPEILLWPCPDFWYHPVREWQCNDVLRESGRIRSIYVADRETTVLDLTQPLPSPPPEPEYRPGEVIYERDFRSVRRVIDLDWSCPNGGQTGYHVPSIQLTADGECELRAGNAYGPVELLRPGLLEHAPSYTATLEGRCGERCERFGILCNDSTPTVFHEENILWLPTEPGMVFHIRLELNADAQTGSLTVNGAEKTFPYAPQEPHGLYLVLKNSDVFLHAVRVTR